MNAKKKFGKLDKFYYHEALDRTYIVANLVEDTLVEHPVIMKHKRLRDKVNEAHELLLQVYQMIGSRKKQ